MKENPRRKAAGRRRFQSKFSADYPVEPDQPPRPYGEDYPVINIAERRGLLRFLPKTDGIPHDVPMNFAQVADFAVSSKQRLGPELKKELDRYQRDNDASDIQHPFWNDTELPLELLRDALKAAKFTIKRYPIIQRSLARLYAVAWCGRGSDSVQAKTQLERLLPEFGTKGRPKHPITKWIPELARKFAETRLWIHESNKMMENDFPKERDRLDKLAKLYDEAIPVIQAALRPAIRPFLHARLADVLRISEVSVRKELEKLPVFR